jgi:Ca2+-transporting ATPase
MRTVREVQSQLNVSAETGLSSAGVAASRQRFGANKLTPLPREPLWKKFLGKFDEPIIKVLLAAALLSMFVDLFQAKGISPWLPGSALLAVAALVAIALVLRLGEWVPALLFGSAVVLFFVGLGAGHASIEGLAVMIAVILATGVAFLSEYKSDREFEVLNAQKKALHVKAVRDGAVHSLSLEEMVVGDVVSLETGDEIPADGRLLKATDLYVDQSLMTGESEPVRKRAVAAADTADGPDQLGCLYRGTQVVDGVGLMLITEVGDATALGQIARRLSAEEEDDDEGEVAVSEEQRVKRKLTISKAATPLQLKLEKLAGLISKVGYVAAVAIFLALLVRGVWVGEVHFTPRGDETTTGQALLASGRALLSYFVYMVIIIVVAVPEGLPMSVTVSLALAMRKMTRANSLVRQLVACETIGSATVICSDKTGTLTQNRMQVVRLFFDGTTHEREASGGQALAERSRLNETPRAPVEWIALNAAVNSTANLEEKKGAVVTVGNSTEGALLQWLREHGTDYRPLRERFEPLFQSHFSSERKRMTTVVRLGERLVTLVKGAPEWVLHQSTHYLATDGTVKPWTPEARRTVEDALRDSASQAMRTLGFGHADLPPDLPATEDALRARREELENGLVFSGFVAIRDPLRPDVKDAVAECRAAGIEVKMITGDNVETARAIAFDVGLIDRRDAPIDTDDAVVMTSPTFNERYLQLKELRERGDTAAADTLRKRLTSFRVLARARPLDKYKMVELLQEEQQVVAVTGDGTNDAPALKKADVGLAMGIAGTEVAKEASKIVLLDDAFSTIVKAVHWGRSLYENIQRFIQFQLTINVSALTIAFLGPFLGVKPPFTVLQLLWINVIMDTFAAIALCSEPPRPGVMRLPPKKKDENIVSPPMVKTIFATAGFFVVVMIALLAGMEYGGWFAGGGPKSADFPELTTRQVTFFFTAYVFFQVWNQINCRSLTPESSGFANLFANPAFLAIAGTVAVVQVLIVSVPWLGAVFKTEPLGVVDWLLVLAGTASVLVFAEVARRVRLSAARG